MAHQVEVIEEQYVFRPETKKKLYILLVVGVAVFILGLILAMNSHDSRGEGQASTTGKELVATADQHDAASEGHAEGGHHA